MKEDIITVVTPTYNRGYILEKCYNSLLAQTDKRFVWLVIDDGSTDNTEDLIKKIISDNKINIEYYKKKNGGKASALNLALDKLETKYFVCLDSDDIFSKNAIKNALKRLQAIEDDNQLCGILALRTGLDGIVLGGKEIPRNTSSITLMELSNKFKINSELICFYKSDIIKQYRFPEILGENFISPAYLEYEVGKKYRFKVSRSIYCYCEYLPDGLTKNKKEVIRKNPKGYTLVKKQSFEQSTNIKLKVKHGIMYVCGSLLSGDKDILNKSPYRLLLAFCYPFGWLIFKIRF